jgi:hypothetical protein
MHRWQKPTRHRKAAIQKHNDKTHVRSPNFQVGDFVLVAEQGKSGVTKLQVEWKGPHRVASVESDYVFVVENLLTQDLKAANATRLIFCKDKKLNVTAELAQAAEHNDHQLYVLSKKLDARYNEQEMFHKLLVAWQLVSLLERPLGNSIMLWMWMFRTWWRIHGFSRGHGRSARDAFSLKVLTGKCYALLRMRPLSNSWAESCNVISCVKVDYDKFG